MEVAPVGARHVDGLILEPMVPWCTLGVMSSTAAAASSLDGIIYALTHQCEQLHTIILGTGHKRVIVVFGYLFHLFLVDVKREALGEAAETAVNYSTTQPYSNEFGTAQLLLEHNTQPLGQNTQPL